MRLWRCGRYVLVDDGRRRNDDGAWSWLEDGGGVGHTYLLCFQAAHQRE